MEILSGTCRVCGCTDDDCSFCVEWAGEPCTWIDYDQTLCSACATAPSIFTICAWDELPPKTQESLVAAAKALIKAVRAGEL